MPRPTGTILSHRGTRMKTLVPVGPACQDGVVLQHFTERGLGEIALDAAELAALLRQLPTPLLVAALQERGAVLTVDLDPPAQTTDEAPEPYQRCTSAARPALGHVCACEAQPGLHVADAACQQGEG